MRFASHISLLLLALLITTAAHADSFWHDVSVSGRLGVSIGGTAPLPMPATIRSINNYTIHANTLIGIHAQKPIGKGFGIMVGLEQNNKDMKTDATVKNYKMTMVQGGESLSGRFTGDVMTKVDMTMVSIPVQLTYAITDRWMIRGGAYLSLLTHRGFEGYAHGGYLRKDDPTGAKVELGEEPAARGTYDFSSDLRRWQMGVEIGADWRFAKRWGAFGEVTWGLTGIHNSDFHTIDQTLYPIFGSLGLWFKIR